MRFSVLGLFGFVALLLCLVQGLYASAISVFPLEADLNYQNRYQDIEVRNIGSTMAYVEVKVIRIEHPGMPNQTLVPMNENPYQIGLIVTPNKLVIPIGQTRIVRALYVGPPPSQDIVYQVKIAPVTGELVAVSSPKSSVEAGIQVVIAYGVTLYMRPMDLQPKVIALRQGVNLTLSNEGNTSVLIANCKTCDSAGLHCTALKNLVVRLYPENTAHFVLPNSLPVSCYQEVLENQDTPFNIPSLKS